MKIFILKLLTWQAKLLWGQTLAKVRGVQALLKLAKRSIAPTPPDSDADSTSSPVARSPTAKSPIGK